MASLLLAHRVSDSFLIDFIRGLEFTYYFFQAWHVDGDFLQEKYIDFVKISY